MLASFCGEWKGPILTSHATQVTWSGPDDPENPKNWSIGRKWAAAFVVSSFTFISPVSSSIIAPAISTLAKDFNVTSDAVAQMMLDFRSILWLRTAFAWAYVVSLWQNSGSTIEQSFLPRLELGMWICTE